MDWKRFIWRILDIDNVFMKPNQQCKWDPVCSMHKVKFLCVGCTCKLPAMSANPPGIFPCAYMNTCVQTKDLMFSNIYRLQRGRGVINICRFQKKHKAKKVVLNIWNNFVIFKFIICHHIYVVLVLALYSICMLFLVSLTNWMNFVTFT